MAGQVQGSGQCTIGQGIQKGRREGAGKRSGHDGTPRTHTFAMPPAVPAPRRAGGGRVRCAGGGFGARGRATGRGAPPRGRAGRAAARGAGVLRPLLLALQPQRRLRRRAVPVRGPEVGDEGVGWGGEVCVGGGGGGCCSGAGVPGGGRAGPLLWAAGAFGLAIARTLPHGSARRSLLEGSAHMKRSVRHACCPRAQRHCFYSSDDCPSYVAGTAGTSWSASTRSSCASTAAACGRASTWRRSCVCSTRWRGEVRQIDGS